MVNQFYDAEIIKEYVIRGNTAVLKCSIPSFVADFVYVESWIDEVGTVYTASENYGDIFFSLGFLMNLFLVISFITFIFSASTFPSHLPLTAYTPKHFFDDTRKYF